MKYTRVTAKNRYDATHNYVADKINFALSERGILNPDYGEILIIYSEVFGDGDNAFQFVELVEEEIDD